MGVGGVKGCHRIKVREAFDLVTCLTGLLNSRFTRDYYGKPKRHAKLIGYDNKLATHV
jgi:hypothetical protein